MNRTEQFELKQKQMPDNELIDLAEKEVGKLCKTGGKSLIMCVPPSIKDTDMILCELIRRFKEKVI